jgi:penicillin amidase
VVARDPPLAVDWADPYRAARIRERLQSLPAATLPQIQAVQLDQVTLLWRELRPVLERMRAGGDAERWRQRLVAWDGDARAESEEAAVFEAWWSELTRLPEKEVGEAHWVYPGYVVRALREGDAACGDAHACSRFAVRALERALLRLHGAAAWGKIHHVVFAHPFLTRTPLRRWSDRTLGIGGDQYTVNVGRYDLDDFSVRDGVSYRQVIDLGDLERSVFVMPMGQSGHLASRNFDDLLPRWRDGTYLPMRTRGYEVAATQRLEPRTR